MRVGAPLGLDWDTSAPTAAGSTRQMPAETAAFLETAYPGDAVDELFWSPTQPS